ncbi:MAG: ABC transporter ATP-binding protein [Myxococcales bacterium]|nr:ABC transporter ATP-binding protein [Myxococcales bacterium]MCB9707567.1 ABC transporter ATP-binding protein [Myxococcales bacterium]
MITAQNVNKYYGSLWAAKNLNFSIHEGECVGFLGLNGAGKSTTLRMLSCLTLPTSGRIRIRGFDVEEHPHEIRRFIGYLPETPPLYGEMTVREFIEFAGRLRGLDHGMAQSRAKEAMALCSLERVRSQVIATLSHGYRQRVGIAQAIVHQPSLLILDEPIKGLDPVQIVEMRQMIRNLRGKHTILLSTHILSEIEKTCDRILMIHQGTIAGEGTEDELAKRFSAGNRVEALVRGSLEAAKLAIARVPEAGQPEIEPQEGVLRIRLALPDDKREALSREIVQANLGLVSLRTLSNDLEAIFIQMSQQDARGEATVSEGQHHIGTEPKHS